MSNEANRSESEFELSFKSSCLAVSNHLDILVEEAKSVGQVIDDFESRLLENEIDDNSSISCIASLNKAISDLENEFMAVEKECEILKQKAIDLDTKETAKLIKKQLDDGLANFKQTTLKNIETEDC